MALQTIVEDEIRVRLYNDFLQSHVGSGSFGTLGLPGLTPSMFTDVRSSESLFPVTPQPGIVIRHSIGHPGSGYRSRELEWRRTHTEALAAFANEWVTLEGEQIVAHGRDPVQVVNEARARGIRTPYVFFVEPSDEDVVRTGL